jgi:hypothetical protein
MFWLMSAFGMVLFLVGWIVPLVQPNLRNLLYAIMAHAQAAQLLISAVAPCRPWPCPRRWWPMKAWCGCCSMR